MTLVFAGVLILVLYLCDSYMLGRPPMATRGAAMLPLARRLNIGLAVFGVAAILPGLLFPDNLPRPQKLLTSTRRRRVASHFEGGR